MAALTKSPCNLCPRSCSARRGEGQRGYCGAGNDVRVARASLHHWEEPVISGSRGSGTVFFSNCSLRCIYCQNRDIAHHEVGKPLGSADLSRVFLDLQSKGALNINCVTPTHYTPDIIDSIAEARMHGLVVPIVWNTSGYENVETVRALEGYVDVYLTDFKYADPKLAQRYSNAADYAGVAIGALESMLDTAGTPRFDEVDDQPRMTGGVIVRHMLLPDAVDNSKRVLRMLFGHFGNDVLYSIMNQYTPLGSHDDFARYPELAGRVPESQYEEVLEYADSIGMEDYFWQDGPAAEESFIPAWDCSGL